LKTNNRDNHAVFFGSIEHPMRPRIDKLSNRIDDQQIKILDAVHELALLAGREAAVKKPLVNRLGMCPNTPKPGECLSDSSTYGRSQGRVAVALIRRLTPLLTTPLLGISSVDFVTLM
jgi:hypothetical protein